MSSPPIASLPPSQPAAAGQPGTDLKNRPDSPQEAAKQFEEMLVKQFVKVMTKGLYKSTMSGEDGPSWMKGQRDSQRDILNDILTNHIVDSGVLGIRERMMKQWSPASPVPEKTAPALASPAHTPPLAPVDPSSSAPADDAPSPAPPTPTTLGILNLR